MCLHNVVQIMIHDRIRCYPKPIFEGVPYNCILIIMVENFSAIRCSDRCDQVSSETLCGNFVIFFVFSSLRVAHMILALFFQYTLLVPSFFLYGILESS
jgi:hypothetical protein